MSRRAADLAISLLLTAVAVHLTIGWQLLDPTYIASLRDDPSQHFLGWAFFRDEPWTFPLGMQYTHGYPTGYAISLSDSIPLVAIPLKLLSPILPHPFQFLGLFCALSLFLNHVQGTLIARRIGYGRWLSHLVGAFFLFSPILIWRLHGHEALTAHWLILGGIYALLRPVTPTVGWFAPFAVLCTLSAAVHPYFLPMTGMIAFAGALRATISDRRLWPHAVGMLVISVISMALVMFVIGTFSVGSIENAGYGGYRQLSLNLLAPFSPQFWPGLFFGGFPQVDLQQGYGYLGIGVLGILLITIPFWPRVWAGTSASVKWPLTGLAVLSTVLALSATITLGSWTLVAIPLPETVERLLSVFRASERLFWPAFYIIFVFAFAALLRAPKAVVGTVLVLALGLQVADLRTIMQSVNRVVNILRVEPEEVTAIRPLLEGKSHLVILPMWACNQNGSPTGNRSTVTFGFLALELGMTLNNHHSARMSASALEYHCNEAPARFLAGELEPDTAYIAALDLYERLSEAVKTDMCTLSASFAVCMAPEENEDQGLSSDL